MNIKRVVAAIIIQNGTLFATQRGKGKYKGYWEFPGGKIENGETPQEALKREISEELATEVNVGDLFCTVEYDYPEFHLSMQCFPCSIVHGELTLLEHQDSCWLPANELHSIPWLPADETIIRQIEKEGFPTLPSIQ